MNKDNYPTGYCSVKILRPCKESLRDTTHHLEQGYGVSISKTSLLLTRRFVVFSYWQLSIFNDLINLLKTRFHGIIKHDIKSALPIQRDGNQGIDLGSFSTFTKRVVRPRNISLATETSSNFFFLNKPQEQYL